MLTKKDESVVPPFFESTTSRRKLGTLHTTLNEEVKGPDEVQDFGYNSFRSSSWKINKEQHLQIFGVSTEESISELTPRTNHRPHMKV